MLLYCKNKPFLFNYFTKQQIKTKENHDIDNKKDLLKVHLATNLVKQIDF